MEKSNRRTPSYVNVISRNKYAHIFVIDNPGIFWKNSVWKISKYGVFSGPHFPAFRLNTERYVARMRENTDQKKTTYLDTFHTVKHISIQRLSFVKLFKFANIIIFSGQTCYTTPVTDKELRGKFLKLFNFFGKLKFWSFRTKTKYEISGI